MRILQAMAGGEQGGAEEFFLRLCQSFADRGVQQRALVRPHPAREAALRDTVSKRPPRHSAGCSI